MDLPSVSSQPGTVGSRFVSQDELDSAKARRDEQWKAAYARLGQEPPPRPVEDAFDGRSLAEKLAANKAAKQEEWEERNKLANQFRALEEDEIQFLEAIKNEQDRQERKREREDAEEVIGFKQAVAARNALPARPPGAVSTSSAATSPPAGGNTATAKSVGKTSSTSSTSASSPPLPRRQSLAKKNGLKGVIVKKKSAPKPAPAKELLPAGEEKGDEKGGKDAEENKTVKEVSEERIKSDENPGPQKKQRVSS